MKTLLFITLISFSQLIKAQDSTNNQYLPNHGKKINFDSINAATNINTANCENIEVTTDEFTGDKTYARPISDIQTDKIEIEKVISPKNGVKYYMFFTAYSGTCEVHNRGITILFTDGTKMAKDVPIDADTYNDSFRYEVALSLSKNDIIIFKSKIIKAFRLYIFDEHIANGDDYRQLLNCLLSKK